MGGGYRERRTPRRRRRRRAPGYGTQPGGSPAMCRGAAAQLLQNGRGAGGAAPGHGGMQELCTPPRPDPLSRSRSADGFGVRRRVRAVARGSGPWPAALGRGPQPEHLLRCVTVPRHNSCKTGAELKNPRPTTGDCRSRARRPAPTRRAGVGRPTASACRGGSGPRPATRASPGLCRGALAQLLQNGRGAEEPAPDHGRLQELCTPPRLAEPEPVGRRLRPAADGSGPRPAWPGPGRPRPTRDRNARARPWQGRRGRGPARVASPS